MSTINFKIDYNSVITTNPEMGSEAWHVKVDT